MQVAMLCCAISEEGLASYYDEADAEVYANVAKVAQAAGSWQVVAAI